ncbi:MAG: nusB [Dehalococcoidia bacterium]|nr:nusB [Dehalococcoidia bacterium]
MSSLHKPATSQRKTKGSGERSQARAVALQALYEIDLARGREPLKVVHRLIEEKKLRPGIPPFVEELVLGVLSNREHIDSILRENAPLWPLEQVSAIDRNILRLAIFEILFDNKVPKGVAINEAVELAKLFGSESSSKFVNGVLGTITQDKPSALFGLRGQLE